VLEGIAAALEASDVAAALRRSRWTYPAVNAGHVLGVALLVGAIVPMDLRLIGVWRGATPLRAAVDLLRPAAAFGAALALVTGSLLFVVQATDYVGHPLFFVKIGLVLLGLAHALLNGGIVAAPRGRQALAGAFSLGLWLTVLVCGRMLGYL
jgi:hypothetical protein